MRLALIFLNLGAFAFNATLGVIDLARSEGAITFLPLTACVISASASAYAIRRFRADRKARRNREDSEAATTAGYFAITSTASPKPTGAGTSLTVREDDQPILAYKAALLRVGPYGHVFFSGLTSMGAVYEMDADAQCHAYNNLHRVHREPHSAPGEACTCGFYAMKSADVLAGQGTAILTVELSGRVVVHENGYRAEHQRVIAVDVPEKCWTCGEPAVMWGETTPPSGTYSTGPQPSCETHAADCTTVYGDRAWLDRRIAEGLAS